MRTLARQNEGVVSQVFLAPLHRIAEWRDAFVDAGSMAVRTQAVEEKEIDEDALRSRYEHIIANRVETISDRDELLDSLADILGEDKKP